MTSMSSKICILAFLLLGMFYVPSYAQDDDDDVRPAPPSIGADVPVTYFGPAPSQVQKELIGPFQLLKSGTLDEDAGTITIPLYQGSLVWRRSNGVEHPVNGKTVWYVLTDTTDLGNARALGLNHSPKLRFANVGGGARWARQGAGNRLVFDQDSAVDFSPELSVTPGDSPNFFPPSAVQPGSVGLYRYSPIARISNLDATYNAPVVASKSATAEDLNQYCDGIPDKTTDPEGYARARAILHDKVVAICPREFTVTLSLTPGFSFARPVLYLSLDAYPATPAALEGATLAPGFADIELGDDDTFGSSVERLFAVINGYTNAQDLPAGASVTSHPSRSGFNSALQGEGGPLNVLGGIPTIATDYSPLWDVNIGEWTQEAVDSGFRVRWLEEFQILGFVQRGLVTGPGGAEFGSTGVLVNCPIVHRFL